MRSFQVTTRLSKLDDIYLLMFFQDVTCKNIHKIPTTSPKLNLWSFGQSKPPSAYKHLTLEESVLEPFLTFLSNQGARCDPTKWHGNLRNDVLDFLESVLPQKNVTDRWVSEVSTQGREFGGILPRLVDNTIISGICLGET